MLLSDVPVLAAHHAPDVAAVRFQDRTITYRELRDRCWRLSNALGRAGQAGDRVAILAAFCRERIASYKKPRHVVFVEALPRNASGKVLKRELRERIAAGELALEAL